jgi:hypothetical protein
MSNSSGIDDHPIGVRVRTGSGNALRSALPLEVNGIASMHWMTLGTM